MRFIFLFLLLILSLNNYSQSIKSKKDSIYIKYPRSEWSFAFDIAVGGGSYTKDLHDYYSFRAFISLGVEAYYKKFLVITRFNGIMSSVDKDFKVGNISWKDSTNLEVTSFEFLGGYNVYENKYFSIIPFAGYNHTSIKPSDYDEEKYPELKNSLIIIPSYALGLTFDLKYKLAMV